jgi:enamine deaminase RidA (YjgF/YER057c/UK114 family)
MERRNFTSGAPWEEMVGYSRAVQIGNVLELSGTVAIDDLGRVVGNQDAYEQTKFIIQKIERVLKSAGATLADVIRTRMFVTDISKWKDYGRAHGEFFKDLRPATSMIEVKSLIEPEYLIEMEATAILKN